MEERISNYNNKSKAVETLRIKISETNIQIKNTDEQLLVKLKEQNKANVLIIEQEKNIENLIHERDLILPSHISVEIQRENLQISTNAASKKVELIRKELQIITTEKTTKTTQENTLTTDLIENKKNIDELNNQLKIQLIQSQFNTKEEVEKALLSIENKNVFTQIKKEFDHKSTEIKALINKNQQDLTTQNNQKNFASTKEESSENKQKVQFQKDEYLKRSGEITQIFFKDEDIIKRNSSVIKEIEIQEKQLKKWKDLTDLLGGSKHAFNTYVQRLTLNSLINIANIHLFKLNKRYSLKMKEHYSPGEELNFNLIDHYQTDEARFVDTSSGGEKFLISLALALGLSDLASSNVKIESLFIDEGFGTLDNETLETVISTLETLQAQGKMIGIISHVENLKERIPTQIQLIKKSNGVSYVEIR